MIKNLLSTLIFLIFASPLQAETHLSVEGSLIDNNLGLRTQSSRAISGSISFDLGDYFRTGFTHRYSTNLLKGYYESSKSGQYIYAGEETKSFSNSIDLTLILYYGQLFLPYVQIGIVRKSYLIRKTIDPDLVLEFPIPAHVVPNAGVGVNIRLSKSFSLKLSYTVSQAARQETPDERPTLGLDSYASAGITYNF